MVAFKDFVPEELSSGSFFVSASHEQIQHAVTRANQWIADSCVEIINVETIVLPNIHDSGEEGSTDGNLRTSGDFSTNWYQFVRVWYQ